MKSTMLLCTALASSAFAQAPVDHTEPVRPLLCEGSGALGSQCYTLSLQGAPVRIAGAWNLSFVDVKDSRCPIDVDCVWVGMVTATFQLNAVPVVSSKEKIVLSLDPRDPTTNVWVDRQKGLKITLDAVTPLKIGRPPMPARYYAHIRVNRIDFVEKPSVACPDIEKPAVCSYQDIQASGSNRCRAHEELENALNQQGISYDPEEIQCEDVGL